MDYEEIDALRLKAFKTNLERDRRAYFAAASKWFQEDSFRRLDHANELAALRDENERLRSIVQRANLLVPVSVWTWHEDANEALK